MTERWVTRPDRGAENGLGATAEGAARPGTSRTVERTGTERASRLAGVPALLAQPFSSGPMRAKPAMASGMATLSPMPGTRTAAGVPSPRANRPAEAAPTTATHSAVRMSIQAALVSLPVPRPCRTATGQLA